MNSRLACALTALTIVVSLLNGCNRCLKKLDIAPTLVGSPAGVLEGSVRTTFTFEECLTKAERQIVVDVKNSLATALRDAREGKITWADFDEYASRVAQSLEVLERTVSQEALDGAGFVPSNRAEAAARVYILSAERPR